jgi:nucleotide-binding universal stress UspA family protein
MFRRILVATDLTAGSIPALRVALEMGRRFAAEVVALYVTEPPYHNRSWYAPFEPSETELLEALRIRQRDAAVRALEEQIEEAHAGGQNGADVRKVVKEGVAADEIPATALEVGADLIVVGTHGRKGAKHLLLGSIAEHVLRAAACPVLTVRPGEN